MSLMVTNNRKLFHTHTHTHTEEKESKYNTKGHHITDEESKRRRNREKLQKQPINNKMAVSIHLSKLL